MSERWLPVVGHERAYEVSDHGRVRSLSRKAWCGGSRFRMTSERVLRHALAGAGLYPAVNLSLDGVISKKWVHRLVLEAFVGQCPPGMEACHGERGKLCAALGNLRWDTKQENAQDRKRHGTPLGGNPYAGQGRRRNEQGQFL